VRGVYWSEKRKAFIVDAKVKGKRLNRQTPDIEKAKQIFREFMEAELKQDFETEIYPKQYASQITIPT
jgi:hypothetical protein